MATIQNSHISDTEWLSFKNNMKTGIKVVNPEKTIYYFFSKSELESSRCMDFSNVNSLLTSQRYGQGVFYDESVGCDGSGSDYSYIAIMRGSGSHVRIDSGKGSTNNNIDYVRAVGWEVYIY